MKKRQIWKLVTWWQQQHWATHAVPPQSLAPCPELGHCCTLFVLSAKVYLGQDICMVKSPKQPYSMRLGWYIYIITMNFDNRLMKIFTSQRRSATDLQELTQDSDQASHPLEQEHSFLLLAQWSSHDPGRSWYQAPQLVFPRWLSFLLWLTHLLIFLSPSPLLVHRSSWTRWWFTEKCLHQIDSNTFRIELKWFNF